MATAWRSRWLDWQPGAEIISVSPETELTKLTKTNSVSFVSPTLGKPQIISAPEHDPAASKEEFARWMAESCICREGRDDWTGIGALLRDFMEWCLAHDAVPCTRGTFERLLSDAGFRFAEGMAAGLLLRVDVEAVFETLTRENANGLTLDQSRQGGEC